MAIAQNCQHPDLEDYHKRMQAYIQRLESVQAITFSDSVLQVVGQKNLNHCEKTFWILLERCEAQELNLNFEEALLNYYNIAKEAEKNNWFTLLAHTHISIARCYENIERSAECLRQLNLARALIYKHQLDSVYARFCLRYSSYHRIYGDRDSSKIYALKSIYLGHKFNVARSVFDGHLLMGILSTDIDSSIYHFQKAVDIMFERGDFHGAASQSINISSKLIKYGRYDEAFSVIDKASHFLSPMKDKSKNYYRIFSRIHNQKRDIFEKKGQIDSAYFHIKLSHKFEKEAEYQVNQEAINANAIEFAIEKEKEKTLHLEKTSRLYVVGILILAILLMIISWAFFIISKKRKQISKQHELIIQNNENLNDSLEKQALLLSEIHHRVKNNLQLVISLLTLHGHQSKSKIVKTYLDDLSKKVYSISLIHEQLYRSGDFEKIDIQKYLYELTSNFQILQNSNINIEFETNLDPIMLNLETVLPLGIICSELISNSLKYAQTKNENIKISITLKIAGSKYLLTYKDNGQGYPDVKFENSNQGMGFVLINNMVRQLQGDAAKYNHSGAIFTLLFEEKKVSVV